MSGLVKACECCGLDYRRPTGSSRISDEKWAERRFCSSVCSIQAAGEKRDHANLGPTAVFDNHQLSASLATAALLKRQMAYYDRLVRERGLTDVWEAAAQVGMAA